MVRQLNKIKKDDVRTCHKISFQNIYEVLQLRDDESNEDLDSNGSQQQDKLKAIEETNEYILPKREKKNESLMQDYILDMMDKRRKVKDQNEERYRELKNNINRELWINNE